MEHLFDMAPSSCAFPAPDGRVYDLATWTNQTIVAIGANGGHYCTTYPSAATSTQSATTR